ncbi:arylamine N-acetyltransferase [Fontibacillus solani]|uniref:Arylamine N-acetyltransferase n=1 Tax=Fontibacillus solani TaxID=1572857 RepID=A0A7W3XSS8_9BACL|nr:arylamine N-acetyltransferase [Fontibacillus solani]MBA9086855.1 arylamine N-acetyltransferase [Fontibacillus solani]
MLTKQEIKDYLKRLGLEIYTPSKEFLSEMHRAHVEKVSWHTIDIFAGKPTPIDIKSSVQHIVNQGSGYCFHLNGAFSVLLRSLGYNVSLHRAGVQPTGKEPRMDSYHLGVSVTMMDAVIHKEQRWIVDVGLGDMPYDPLPIIVGEYEQGPFRYKIRPSEVAANGWRLENDPIAPFAGVDFDPEVVGDVEEFKSQHEFLSKSPDSVWGNLLLIQNRHNKGSNELRGCVFSQRTIDGIQKSEITNKFMWFELVADVFGEKLDRYSKLEKDEIWKKVIRIHENWKREQMKKTE